MKRIKGFHVLRTAVFILLSFCVARGGGCDVHSAGDYANPAKPAQTTAQEAEAAGNVLELYAGGAVLMDGDSGRVLYAKEADRELPMASTTKIMTCILALEMGRSDMVCTVSENAAAQPRVKLGMQKGERYFLKDLLYSLMLESHNDTAVCIAESVAGSVGQFVELMNQKAEEMGCTHTHYVTPNGLDGEDALGIHHTTARELALVMRYCLTRSPKAEEFLKITGEPSYSFSDTEGKRSFSCINHNALLTIMEGALSGKTGFTGKAGYCYVGALEREDKLLIVALLACGWPNHKGYKWADTRRLVNYGLENFEKRQIINHNLPPVYIDVENGQQTTVTARVSQAKSLEILLRPQEKTETEIETVRSVRAPVKEGQQVGRVRYLLDGEILAEYPVLVMEEVRETDFAYCLKMLWNQWLLSRH